MLHLACMVSYNLILKSDKNKSLSLACQSDYLACNDGCIISSCTLTHFSCMFNVDIIYLACSEQKYATIHLTSAFIHHYLACWHIFRSCMLMYEICLNYCDLWPQWPANVIVKHWKHVIFIQKFPLKLNCSIWTAVIRMISKFVSMFLYSKPYLFGVPALLMLYTKVHACNYISNYR